MISKIQIKLNFLKKKRIKIQIINNHNLIQKSQINPSSEQMVINQRNWGWIILVYFGMPFTSLYFGRYTLVQSMYFNSANYNIDLTCNNFTLELPNGSKKFSNPLTLTTDIGFSQWNNIFISTRTKFEIIHEIISLIFVQLKLT